MEMETIQYTVPTWAICAIEYGDLDGLSTEDITNLDEFMTDLPKRIYGIEYSEEPFFATRNDICSLGADCVTATVFFSPRKQLSDTEMYLDWLNNFLTVEKFAEYYGLTVQRAKALIEKERASI